MPEVNPGKVITFYSYKGGTGRTMALANVACLLAQRQAAAGGRGVLMIDWDLEAPGLHRYFRETFQGRFGNGDNADETLRLEKGLIELFGKLNEETKGPDYASEEQTAGILRAQIERARHGENPALDLLIRGEVASALSTDGAHGETAAFDRLALDGVMPSLLRKIEGGHCPGLAQLIEEELARALLEEVKPEEFALATDIDSLSLIKAGRFDEDYASRVNTFQWQALFERSPSLIRLLAERFASHYDYVLIDSRTGETDISGICTMLLPERLVVVFTPNRQSLLGARDLIGKATEYRRQSEDSRPLIVFPLPSRVELSEDRLRELWRSDEDFGYQKVFEKLFKKVYELGECRMDDYFNKVLIRHASHYAYGEEIAVMSEQHSDILSLTSGYESFTHWLIDEPFPWEHRIRAEAQDLVEEQARRAEAVFGSFTQDEQIVAQRVFTRLVRVSRPDLEGDDTRWRVSLGYLSQLGPSALKVVHTLSGAHLVVIEQEETGKQTVQLTEEALIKGWRRLRYWVDADRGFLYWWQRLRTAHAEWEASGRAKGALLHGALLIESATWVKERKADLSDDEREYIGTSLTKHAASKRMQRVAWASVVLILIVSGWMLWSLNSEKVKLARQLASKAVAMVNSGRSSLLQLRAVVAVESLKLYSTSEAREALRESLIMLPGPVGWLDHNASVVAVAFSPDGKYLARFSGGAQLWDLQAKIEKLPLEQDVIKQGGVNAITFSSDGRYVATAGSGPDHTAIVWDLPSFDKKSFPHADRISAIAFSPDGKYLATGCWDGSARVWDIQKAIEVWHRQHDGYVKAVAFSSNGTYLATASADTTARVWSAANGADVSVMQHDPAEGGVNCVVFSPDDKYLVTASFDKTARVWDVIAGNEVSCMRHDANVNAVVMDKSGKYVATASFDKTARIWEMPGGREVKSMPHDGSVYAVAFSHNADYLATASEDRTARVWETITGQEISRMIHDDSVFAIAFSPDDKNLATGSADKSAWIWETKNSEEFTRLIQNGNEEKLIELACSRVTRDLTVDWPVYVPGVVYRKSCPDKPALNRPPNAGRPALARARLGTTELNQQSLWGDENSKDSTSKENLIARQRLHFRERRAQ